LKVFLLLIIKLYWKFIPSNRRRNCLFKESCSKYVYRKLDEEGLNAGVEALQLRYRQCRPGYRIEKKEGDWELTLVDGTLLKNEEISEHILLRKD
jgi:putative component of membrane protein insertase Oxa1/YidC/SpoIIIJ protein YidD